MKAMVFAAGLGTRLRPLTDDRPKALVEVCGVPLLELALRRLLAAGCREVIVNVHHFAEKVIAFLEQKNHFGIRIAISDESGQLLETGGGLQKAAWFFDDGQPFLVCNADVITDMDLAAFYRTHLHSGALATLAVRDRPSSRYFIFDEKMQLAGWQNSKSGEQVYCRPATPADRPLAFSGIHAVSPAIFRWMPKGGVEKFSIIDTYLQAAATETILGYPHNGDRWMDVGTPEALALAQQALSNKLKY